MLGGWCSLHMAPKCTFQSELFTCIFWMWIKRNVFLRGQIKNSVVVGRWSPCQVAPKFFFSLSEFSKCFFQNTYSRRIIDGVVVGGGWSPWQMAALPDCQLSSLPPLRPASQLCSLHSTLHCTVVCIRVVQVHCAPCDTTVLCLNSTVVQCIVKSKVRKYTTAKLPSLSL